MIEIKHKITGTVLFTVPIDSLSGANHRSANLRYADLSGADLSGADLWRADLSGADLRYANLSGADLRYANLSGANLSGANLRYANLSGANLSGADLRYANLSGADLRYANLSGSDGIEQQIIVPEGAITGYKKTTSGIAVLEIPRSAARVNAYGSRKCRCEYAIVVQAPEGSKSMYDNSFAYAVGETVRPDSYDPDPMVECSHGIHFFITRKEAEDY